MDNEIARDARRARMERDKGKGVGGKRVRDVRGDPARLRRSLCHASPTDARKRSIFRTEKCQK